MITRFAPSPTNNSEDKNSRGLHIGSCRTILFNYLIAKKNKDPFLCRLENTDISRSNEDCLKCMIRDWEWLFGSQPFDAGFKIDNGKIVEYNNTNIDIGPLKQSNRLHIYSIYINQLLKEDKAYEKDGAIFFRMPKENISYNDLIVGQISISKDQCEDFVIQKNSGMISFYFGLAIDDEFFKIQTILRCQEHISSSFKQIALQRALGFKEVPIGSMPLVMNSNGSKMSKRQTEGQVNLHDFRKDGYIPEAIINYIALLGWSFPNKEKFTLEEMIQQFDIKDIVKANARFDYKKLLNLNSQYLREMPFEQFCNRLFEYGKEFYPEKVEKIVKLNLVAKFTESYLGKCKLLSDPFKNCDWLFNISYDEKAIEKNLIKNNGLKILESILAILEKVIWNDETLMAAIKQFTVDNKLSMSKVSQSLRVSLVGGEISPSIEKTLTLLGREESLNRIKNCLAKFTITI